ncbi:protein STICHEL-like 4 [Iris pallida]|uniref:Protein STICHEL-like 4 n=1 Tax=Iris pallida TaxID=29817 RepID=A0AAX6F691_IRIPA|nr:protein STICHEL-like 4 [Iris pallida]
MIVIHCLLFPGMPYQRCQKFFFPKLRDSDIICTLQWIATSEGLQIDKDALKLIASRSDGSLRDAETTLDQLTLLGQRISLPLVQELVGLVSDEKLVDLLDLALSADTVNTVKSLREVIETGVEPLGLISQLATIITDILAGSYVFTRERLRRNFFRHSSLSKEDMERLRQALKTLSEAEKQLRMSNDRSTWLTAALLQLAPDQQYTLPTSSAYTSLNQSPLGVNQINKGDLPRNSADEGFLCSDRGCLRGIVLGNHSGRGACLVNGNSKRGITSYIIEKRNCDHSLEGPIQFAEATDANGGFKGCRSCKDYEQIWRVALDNIQSDTLKQFLFAEGKLGLVSLGTAPMVELMFTSPANKAKAEKCRGQILQAFESALHSAVRLGIRCENRLAEKQDLYIPLDVLASEKGSQLTIRHQSMTNQRSKFPGSENCMKGLPSDNVVKGTSSSQSRRFHNDPLDKGEITGIRVASPQDHRKIRPNDSTAGCTVKSLNNMWLDEASSMQYQPSLGIIQSGENPEQHNRQSLVRRKVSLARVIQHAEGCAQRGGWSRRKAISIAEKLEQENMRLEPRSRSLLCWRVPRIPPGKLPPLRIRSKKPCCLQKMVTFGRCLGARSPR